MNVLTDFPYKNALVLGLAKSGTAAAKLLLRSGIHVCVNDLNSKREDQSVIELEKMGAKVILGAHPLSVLDGIQVLVKNPGIPYEHELISEALKRNIPVITEIELAGRLLHNDSIGITGSNGKTTTTTLVREMLLNSKIKVKAAGNIGEVATEVVQELDDELLVLELSSFQLMGIETFKPKIAVLLNIFEAHLDYHHTVENYIAAKLQIMRNQTEDDYVVYNAEDKVLQEAVQGTKGKLVPFSITGSTKLGSWADDEAVYFKDERIMSRKDIVLVGEHNLENILAAIASVKLAGATNEGIRETLTTFSGVKHRLQFVTKKNDRIIYNDSKATNILATQKALASFADNVILLCGGLDRGNEFTDLLPYFNHVKGIVLFGETASKLERTAKEANIPSIQKVNNMQEAVEAAYKMSSAGDVILLSPACASWDQYPTFEKRGDMFIEAVHTLV